MAELPAQTEKLLSISVEQYRDLVDHAEMLLDSLDNCDYANISAHTARLQQQQTAASQHDQILLALFNKDPSAWENHPLYLKRIKLIKSILELNRQLIPRIKSTMAVTSAELVNLRGGRT
ncbi:MAG: hypothetical protein JRJ68_11365, partial [Deltaproteobacteria bacterium]|nr:hypothetical protein [Deltaproteobacteria bacterium]